MKTTMTMIDRLSPSTPFGAVLVSAVLLLGSTLLTGCADTFFSAEDSAESTQPDDDAKFRHAHLLPRALRATPGKSASANTLGLIVAVQSGVDKQKIVDRYKIASRFKVANRFEYDLVFEGFAWTVDDTTGSGAYQEFLDSLVLDPDILWFEPDFDVTSPPSNPMPGGSGQQVPWSVAAVGGQTSWAVSGDGQGSVNVDVYILDTGVAKANTQDPGDDLLLVENGDFREGLNDARDYDGHGTHVAGIIAAADDNDGLVGLAPSARVHNYKVLGDDGRGDVSQVIAAIEQITAEKLSHPWKPMVVNLSLGEDVGNNTYGALDDAVSASVAAGVVYVVAAGNHSKNASNVTPAKVASAITVGSHALNGSYSSFSNYGTKVDLLAPGEGIVSLSPGGSGQAVSMSGTSMAAAHVTGAVALYLGQHPAASPAEVAQALGASAKDFVTGAPSSTTTKSVWVGEGGSGGAILSTLVAKHSNKCAVIEWGSQNDGAKLKQQWCNGNSAQQFELAPVAGKVNVYTLVAQHSGKCLDVLGAAQSNGALLLQWTCHGGTNQQFKAEPVSGNAFRLVAQHSGKCVDVKGASQFNNAEIQQWDCHGGSNQQWQIDGLD